MNKKIFYFYWGFCTVLVVLMVCSLGFGGLHTNQTRQQQTKKLAAALLLTDFCLSTESRHTRHFTMPELIAPFQDFPAYHEHFPSSTFMQGIKLE
jgi:hypothetical protein